MKIKKQSVLYGASILALSGGILQILLFVYRIILSRLIGAEGMGVYQLIFPPAAVIMALALSGLTVAVSRLSAEYGALGDICGLRRLIHMSEIFYTVIFIPLGLGLFFGAKFISQFLLGDERVAMALLALPAYIFLTGIENIHKSCFQGLHDMKPVAFSETSELIIRMVFVTGFLVIFAPNNPSGAVMLIVCGMVVSEIFSSVFLMMIFNKRYKKPSYCQPKKDEKLLSKIAAIAVPISLAGIVNNLLSSANSVILPQSLVASGMNQSEAMQEFGVLSGMVIPLFMLPFSLTGSLSAVIVPRLSKENMFGHTGEIKRKAAKAIHATSLFSLPVIAVLIPLANSICSVIYKQEIPKSYVFPLAIGSVFSYYAGMSCSVLYGLGHQKSASIISVGGEILQFGFTFFLASDSRLGIYGFLAGFVLSAVMESLCAFVLMIKKTKLKVMWTNWFVIPLVSAGLSGYTALFLHRWFSARNVQEVYAVIFAILPAILLYYLLLRFQGVSPGKYISAISDK